MLYHCGGQYFTPSWLPNSCVWVFVFFLSTLTPPKVTKFSALLFHFYLLLFQHQSSDCFVTLENVRKGEELTIHYTFAEGKSTFYSCVFLFTDFIRCRTPSKIHCFFSFYIEVFKSLVDKEVNIGQKANDFPMVSQAEN